MAKKASKSKAKSSKPAKSASKAASPKPAKISAAPKIRSKSEVYGLIAAHTGLARKQVSEVFDTMQQMVKVDLNGKAGIFAVPGMMKIVCVRKPATKGGMRPNPFKPGEMMEVKARPARNVIKIRPLKALKAMV